MSFVVAQHLSPTHKSLLTMLLDRETTLSVVELESGQAPVADTVYITPPNADVTYRDGKLVLSVPEKPVGPKPSINRLFDSLAEELSEDSVGIILSGTGADGAQGLAAISKKGGLTIVQTPASAKYDGMPQAAAHELEVDYLLTVPAIADLLIAYATDGITLPNPEVPVAQGLLARVVEMVKTRTNFDLGVYKASTLQRRLQRRMDRARLEDPEEYLALLQKDEHEPADLAREILVSVTEFFRDHDAFQALGKAIYDLVEGTPPHQVIRVWNPGCATGEEAYSIAMLFEEACAALGRNRNYQIFATDIDEKGLSHGRAGSYARESVSAVPSALRAKYFQELGGTSSVSKSLRDRIIFSAHNLVCDPPFSRIDLVSCRNLLIYLTVPLQARIFRLFHYTLNAGGLLFLGKAESIEPHRDVFTDVDRDARLFRALNVPVRLSHVSLRGSAGTIPRPSASSRARQASAFQETVKDQVLAAFAPPSLVLNAQDEVIYALGNVNPYLAFREGAIGTTITSLIRDELRAELRALLFKARREGQPVQGGRHRWEGSRSGAVRLTVQPLARGAGEPDGALALVVIEQVSLEAQPSLTSTDDAADPDRLRAVVAMLEQELSITRQNLSAVVEELENANEELQALNEEMQSSNEELQSTNEELQTANEELQSTNEELLTVNDELQAKSRELERAMFDIQNIVESNTNPLLVVERDLRVRRFVKAVDAVIPIEQVHVGDLITTLPWRVDIPKLRAVLNEVISTGKSRQSMLTVGDRFFTLHITPYRSGHQDIEGAVLWFGDVSELERTRIDLERSQSYLSTIVDNVVDGIVTIDESGRILTANYAAERIFGYERNSLKGQDLDVLLPPLQGNHQSRVLRYLKTQEKRIIGSTRSLEGRRRDGSLFPLELGVSEIIFQGHRLFCGIMRDVTQRVKTENQVNLLERKASATLQCISDAIVTVDARGLIDYLNPVAERLTGVLLDKASGRPLSEVYRVFDEATREPLVLPLGGPDAATEVLPECLLLTDVVGTEYSIEQSLAPIASASGVVQGTVIAFRDVSSKRRMLEKITWQARHDPLTGLVNRVEFDARLERSVQSAKSFQRTHALLYIDLDQFKVVNDTCGHRAGDDFLRQIAGHICVHLRQRDTLARLGGDEFAAILENCTLSQGEHIAAKLRETIQAFRFNSEDRIFKVGASIGVVEVTSKVASATEALSMADVACYSAKESGRNRIVVYNPDNAVLAQQRHQMDWVTRLNAAVDDHRLRLFFQLVHPLKDKYARHWEVLVRMVDTDGALILPGVFLPAAERYGMIASIDRWVLSETLDLLSAYGASGKPMPRVSINLSAASLGEQSFHVFAREQLRSRQVKADHICFEITETTAITNLAVVRQFMSEMKQLGCKFALDDFGSGMCSYGYLRSLPADYVKIDGIFVKDIKHDAVSLSLVESINRISQLMNLVTIAECAEDEAIIERLKQIGVDYIQGFGIGRPIPADEFLARC